MGFVEEVAVAGLEGAELAAEHRLANEPIVVAMAVELLLRPVVDARDTHRRDQEAEHGNRGAPGLVLARTLVVREP